MSDAHVHHQRARKPRQGRPVDPGLAGLLWQLSLWIGVTGHEGHGRGRAAVRDGDAGERRRANARGNARHDLEGDAMTNEKLGLLGPSSENQRIAPLEPDDHPPGGCMLEQDLVDLVLVERAMPARLPRADPQRTRPWPGRAIASWRDGRKRRRRRATRPRPRAG